MDAIRLAPSDRQRIIACVLGARLQLMFTRDGAILACREHPALADSTQQFWIDPDGHLRAGAAHLTRSACREVREIVKWLAQ